MNWKRNIRQREMDDGNLRKDGSGKKSKIERWKRERGGISQFWFSLEFLKFSKKNVIKYPI